MRVDATAAAGLLHYCSKPDDGFYQDFLRQMQAAPGSIAAARAALGSVELQSNPLTGRNAEQQLQYASLLASAYAANAQQASRAYLQTLDAQQLAVLQHAHFLADAIQPANLSEEAARNLLLPAGFAVDLDHDLMLEVGAARTCSIPPQDAPPEFVQAWSEAMASLPPEARGIAGMVLLLRIYGLDLSGDTLQLVRRDNRPSQQLASYRLAISEELDMLRAHPECYHRNYDAQLAFWRRLAAALDMAPA